MSVIFNKRNLKGAGTRYGAVSIPRAVMAAWQDVEMVDIIFDEKHNTIIILPRCAEQVL